MMIQEGLGKDEDAHFFSANQKHHKVRTSGGGIRGAGNWDARTQGPDWLDCYVHLVSLIGRPGAARSVASARPGRADALSLLRRESFGKLDFPPKVRQLLHPTSRLAIGVTELTY